MSRTAVFDEAVPISRTSDGCVANRLGPLAWLALSAWCGLAAGLLEVGATVLRKRTYDPNHLYWMSRHFIWLVPLIDLGIFLLIGVVLYVLRAFGGRRGPYLANRFLGGCPNIPTCVIADEQCVQTVLVRA